MTCFTAFLMGAAILPAACGDASDRSAVTSRAALTFPGGSNISSLTYEVLSSAGATLAAGTVAVSNPNVTFSVDLMLAPGTGNVVELTATTNTGALCTGTSAPFDVVAGAPTFVNLTLICGGDQPASDGCPEIQSWAVTPVQAVAPNGTISVDVTATDPDATQTLSYAWIATDGTFGDPSAASTTYTCTTIGSQTLTLTARAGTTPSTCAATATFLVDCVASADAGALR